MLPDHDPAIEAKFPQLNRSNYKITSQMDVGYNCIAWAVPVNSQWWEPDQNFQYYWPANLPRVYTIENFILAYQTCGYDVCNSSEFETGYEKIAIYTDAFGNPLHASRQLNQDMWTSKLGPAYDISHEFDALHGAQYGEPRVFMRRKIK